MNNELYHHGVQGQKWGIRRYQNEDGSLTALGRARLGYENTRASVADARTSYYAKRNKQLQAKIENQNLKNQLKAAKNQNKGKNNNNNNKNTEINIKKNSLSEISDKDMRDILNRYDLEKRYKVMLTEQNPVKKSAGKKFVEDSLKTIGDIVVRKGSEAVMESVTPYIKKKVSSIIDKKKG